MGGVEKASLSLGRVKEERKTRLPVGSWGAGMRPPSEHDPGGSSWIKGNTFVPKVLTTWGKNFSCKSCVKRCQRRTVVVGREK